MAYTWAPVPIETCGLMRLHRAHRRAETRDAGWVWYACRLLAHEFQADGRLEYDGLPLEAADLAHRIGTPPEMVQTCLDLFLEWGEEGGGWLRTDADGCYVVVDAEPMSAEQKDARRRALANARQARRRSRLAGEKSSPVTPDVTPNVTGSVTPVTPTVTDVTQDVTLVSRSASRSLARAIASETETEKKTPEIPPVSPPAGGTGTDGRTDDLPDWDPLQAPTQWMAELFNQHMADIPDGNPAQAWLAFNDRLVSGWYWCRKMADADHGNPQDVWREYLRRLFANDYLTGRKAKPNGDRYVMDLEFVLRDRTWAKAWNGGYREHRAVAGASSGPPSGIGAWSQKRKAAELAAAGGVA